MRTIDKAVQLIRKIGGETYIVGGAVRDIIIGIVPHDIDIATNVSFEYIESLGLELFDIGKSKDFGIMTVKYQDELFEIAQFRSEESYSNNRHPDKIKIGASLETDAARRDFTINSMYMNKDYNIIDIYEGQNDIKNALIKTVNDPYTRFNEDALRMLRCLRFAAKYNYDIESNTFSAIFKLAKNINNISTERISDELFKTASYGGQIFCKYITLLFDTDLISYIIPELIEQTLYDHYYKDHPEGAMVFDQRTEQYIPYSIKTHGIDPTNRYIIDNGSVLDHTLSALNKSTSTNPITNLAILFHDIGKPYCAELNTSKNGHTFFDHDINGINIFKTIAKRLKFSNDDIEEIAFCIEHHMKFRKDINPQTIIPIRQSKYWNTLKNVLYCDAASRNELFDENNLNKMFTKIEEIYKIFGEKEIYDNKMKELINGNIIKELFPNISGKDIAKKLNICKQFIIDNEWAVTKEDVKNYIKD